MSLKHLMNTTIIAHCVTSSCSGPSVDCEFFEEGNAISFIVVYTSTGHIVMTQSISSEMKRKKMQVERKQIAYREMTVE